MTIVTRFAPSPTGDLHIGGARTALFNYLFAKKNNGKFLLRVEDTDLERSTKKSLDSIIDGLSWLGIHSDDDIVFQQKKQQIHAERALKLVDSGHAYKCYCTKQELESRRNIQKEKGEHFIYDGRCRNITDHSEYKNKPFTIRLKVNKEDTTIVQDLIKGEVKVSNETIEDFIILRSDNTPTYMLAAVIDDYDMNVTHVIRGDDHFTNTFKQVLLYNAFNYPLPTFAHLPLIHGSDGSKLSKRHGAVSVHSYKKLGFMSDAMCNYLLRLGWSHNNDEIISFKQALEWFDIKDVNQSPAKFDMNKLIHLNHHYIQNRSNEDLISLIDPFIKNIDNINPNYKSYLIEGLTSIKKRSKNLLELVDNSIFYIRPIPFTLGDKANYILQQNHSILEKQFHLLKEITDWNRDNISNTIKDFCTENNITLKQASEGLRIALTGSDIASSSNFDIMCVLGREETINRLNSVLYNR